MSLFHTSCDIAYSVPLREAVLKQCCSVCDITRGILPPLHNCRRGKVLTGEYFWLEIGNQDQARAATAKGISTWKPCKDICLIDATHFWDHPTYSCYHQRNKPRGQGLFKCFIRFLIRESSSFRAELSILCVLSISVIADGRMWTNHLQLRWSQGSNGVWDGEV